MSAVDPKGDQKYWINGGTYEGIRFEPSKVGEQTYWINGMTEENLTPLQNFDTGRFFFLFD